MHLPSTDPQQMLDEFLARYGRDGVLVLYFTNLLEDIVRGEFLHTLDSEAPSSSPGIIEHAGPGGKLAGKGLLQQKEGDLRRECERRAIQIVEKLKALGLADAFSPEKMEQEAVVHEVNVQLKAIFRDLFSVDWGSES